MRIPMLEVMLALGHFYLNDGFGKNRVYKLLLPLANCTTFRWGKYVRSCHLEVPYAAHSKEKNIHFSGVLPHSP